MRPTCLSLDSLNALPRTEGVVPPLTGLSSGSSAGVRCLADLLQAELCELVATEESLRNLLLQLRDAAHAGELKDLMGSYQRLLEEHLEQLELTFANLERTPGSESSASLQLLSDECQRQIHRSGTSAIRDAALIAFAQRLLHYQMACYGTARSFAEHLGWLESARLLQASLAETKEMDRQFTELAERHVNLLALHD